MPETSGKSHAAAPRRAAAPGKFHRPFQVTIVGAGTSFTTRLVSDFLHMPGADQVRLALIDTDDERLQNVVKVARRLIKLHDKSKWTVVASSNRREMLAGTDYLINCLEVGGIECIKTDYEIPLKYGVDQCVADTAGPGGLFKALRTIPVWLQVLADAEAVCPEALVLNHANPMNMMCLAAERGSKMRVAGLGRSVQPATQLLAKRLGVAYDELVWECAGINRMSWITKLEHKGHDVYPALMKKAREDLAGKPSDPSDAGDLVRKDLMLNFGAFATGSSGHLSEYVPYYRKRPDLIQTYCGAGYDGESGYHAKQRPKWREQADMDRIHLLTEDSALKWKRSAEYASWIIEAREKDTPARVYANVSNLVQGAYTVITNLPADSCIEVACRVDRTGIHPIRYGTLARPLAALCDSNIRMFDLGVRAAMEKSKEAAIHALLLDPLTSAACGPAQIRDLALAMFEAQAKYLPDYK